MMLTRYWANPRGDTMFTMAVVVIASVLLYGIAGFALYMVHYMVCSPLQEVTDGAAYL